MSLPIKRWYGLSLASSSCPDISIVEPAFIRVLTEDGLLIGNDEEVLNIDADDWETPISSKESYYVFVLKSS